VVPSFPISKLRGNLCQNFLRGFVATWTWGKRLVVGFGTQRLEQIKYRMAKINKTFLFFTFVFMYKTIKRNKRAKTVVVDKTSELLFKNKPSENTSERQANPRRNFAQILFVIACIMLTLLTIMVPIKSVAWESNTQVGIPHKKIVVDNKLIFKDLTGVDNYSLEGQHLWNQKCFEKSDLTQQIKICKVIMKKGLMEEHYRIPKRDHLCDYPRTISSAFSMRNYLTLPKGSIRNYVAWETKQLCRVEPRKMLSCGNIRFVSWGNSIVEMEVLEWTKKDPNSWERIWNLLGSLFKQQQ